VSIIGHQKIISFFDKMIDKDSLSQSYCFVGVSQAGKRTAARYLSARLLKVREEKLDTHPDFYYLTREIDAKTDKLKKDISAAQAKQIKIRLGGKSWFGGYQAVIIDEAEKLNEEAGNALLKLLEGTAGRRVFFLLTTDDNALLPTIRSRCQMFYFLQTDNAEIEKGLLAMGIEPEKAAEAALLSWGRPGRAVQIAGDEDLRKSFNQEIDRWQKIVGQPFHQKLKAVEDLLDDPSTRSAAAARYGAGKKDSVRVSEKLNQALEIWTVLWRKKILEQVKDNSSFSFATIKLLDGFKQAQILLSQNINPRLVIEQVLLSVS